MSTPSTHPKPSLATEAGVEGVASEQRSSLSVAALRGRDRLRLALNALGFELR
jgi:hypothetical protein